MAALLRTGAISCSVPALPNTMSKDISACLSPHCGAGGSAARCVRPNGGTMIVLRTLDRSKVRERFELLRGPYRGPPIGSFRLRAANNSGSNVDEKVREIAADDAVEGPNFAERDAKLKAEELKSEAQSDGPATELPVAADLLLSALNGEDESADSALEEKDAVLDVAAGSTVEDSKHFFEDVKGDAEKIAGELGRSVEDEPVELENRAEGLEERQEREAELVNKGEFDVDDETSTGTSSDESSDEESDTKLPTTRGEAEQKLRETARDGYEVLKWAAEGVASAGQNAKGGLGVVKEALDKRVKSFCIAADETREVSSQAAEVAQKKFGEIHGSASKFGEELQVNIEEKKAADSSKPESERNPFAQLNESLSQNLSKASQAGREFTTRVSERAAELSDNAKENAGDITGDYEDERGNDLLEGQISSKNDNTTSKVDVDEAQAVPSKRDDGSDIGHDE